MFLCSSSQKSTRSSRRYNNRTDDTFNAKRCLSWFTEYTTPDDPEMLGPDGMERFCEDICVEPENVAMLVLAYKMGARQMGFFTQAEWLKGLTELQCDTPAKVQAKLEHMRNSLNDYAAFKGVYRYAYDFARVSCADAALLHVAGFDDNNEWGVSLFPLLLAHTSRTKTSAAWTLRRREQCCSCCWADIGHCMRNSPSFSTSPSTK